MAKSPKKKQVNVEDIMKSPVFSVGIKDSVRDVAKLFLDKNISGAPVVDNLKVPIGVITKTDLCRCEQSHVNVAVKSKDQIEAGADQPKGYHVEEEDESVEDWMTPFVFDTHPGTPLAVACQKMVKYGLHHLFITEKELNQVVGVITSFDVLAYFARTQSENPEMVHALDPEKPQPSY